MKSDQVNKPTPAKDVKAIVIAALEDLKGKNIVTLDVRPLTGVTDFMIIASGNSSRHVKSLADNVLLEAKKQGINSLGTEGQQAADWVLVDFGDVLVHVMQEDTRRFYDLEKLWTNPDSAAGDKPKPEPV